MFGLNWLYTVYRAFQLIFIGHIVKNGAPRGVPFLNIWRIIDMKSVCTRVHSLAELSDAKLSVGRPCNFHMVEIRLAR